MQQCGALRDPVPGSRPKGWECDGADLVVVIPAGRTLPPAVIRRDLIDQLGDLEREVMEAEGGQDFPGGDHAHVTLPPTAAEAAVGPFQAAPGVVP